MPRNARKWTDPDIDEKWLESKIPDYQKLMQNAKSGKKNSQKRSYVLDVIEQYRTMFPKRLDKMEFRNSSVKSSVATREEQIFNVIVIVHLALTFLADPVFNRDLKTGLRTSYELLPQRITANETNWLLSPRREGSNQRMLIFGYIVKNYKASSNGRTRSIAISVTRRMRCR